MRQPLVRAFASLRRFSAKDLALQGSATLANRLGMPNPDVCLDHRANSPRRIHYLISESISGKLMRIARRRWWIKAGIRQTTPDRARTTVDGEQRRGEGLPSGWQSHRTRRAGRFLRENSTIWSLASVKGEGLPERRCGQTQAQAQNQDYAFHGDCSSAGMNRSSATRLVPSRVGPASIATPAMKIKA